MDEIPVIVNADDLGISQKVNCATFELIEAGLVTSATLMANAPHIEDACERAKEFPNCSFGVHLNVTQFQPLSSPGALEPLLDNSGAFDWERIRQVSIDSSLAKGIFEEFCSQIDRLQSLNVAVTHIDSHHHVHTLPRLFPILKRVQKKFQIRRVRISRNIYAGHENVSRSLLLKKTLFNILLKYYYRTKTTQGFTDLKAFIEKAESKQIKHKSVEVMVHLGSDSYVDDTEVLVSPWQASLGFQARLISYGDIG